MKKTFRFCLWLTCIMLILGAGPASALSDAQLFRRSDDRRLTGADQPAPVRCPAPQWIVKYRDPAQPSLSLAGRADPVEVEAARTEAAQRLSEAAGMLLAFVREMSGEAFVFAAAEVAARGEGLETQSDEPPSSAAGACITEEQAWAVAERLSKLPEVEYAESDRIMGMALTPNDNMLYYQWYLGNEGADSGVGINAEEAWEFTSGSAEVVVAVVDSGITDHAELQGRILYGYDLVSDPWMANDGDGWDANASDPGNWIYPNECYDGSPGSPSSWHGTHVAGIIGAKGNNNEGVAGVNWNSRILPVRVIGRCGGRVSDIVDGMRWAAGLPVPGAPANTTPADVLNLSITGRGVCRATEQAAINEILAAGTTVVVSAGNENENVEVYTPASCTGVLSVAATDYGGERAPYSNFGALVDLSAPGGTLDSEWKGILSLLNVGPRAPAGDAYEFYQGTSMAAPNVAGTASLLYSMIPGITPAQVSQVLLDTATPFWQGNTCTSAICGSGIVNAGWAVGILPRLTGLSPREAPTGSSLTLTVNGANFANGAVIYWDGAPRTTTFVSNTQLTIELTSADLALPGTHQVSVATSVLTYGTMRTLSKTFVTGLSTPSFMPLLTVNGLSKLRLQNGGFEQGLTGWTYFSNLNFNLVPASLEGLATPRSGSLAAWLGGANNEMSVLQQRVTIPPEYATLVYYQWIRSSDECAWDWLEFTVDYYPQATESLCYYNQTNGWVKKTVSLTGYGNGAKTVLLRWTVRNDSSYPSHVFLDDIALTRTEFIP
jgi:serine protease